jgi:hypothetical protein
MKLCNGKYEFYRDVAGVLCKRHGEPWRDFIGDKAVNALFEYALQLEHELSEAQATIQRQLRYAEAVAEAMDRE